MSPIVCIPTPCAQPWAVMSPTLSGRHCAACQTEVVDFTRMTQTEILAYLRGQRGRAVCGRLRAEQLAPARPLSAAAGRWRSWASALLTLGSLGTILLPGAAAQVPVPRAATAQEQLGPAHLLGKDLAQQPESEAALRKRIAANPVVVRGVVLDAYDHRPAPGVTVLMNGSLWGTSTNEAGEFELTVTPHRRHVELVISFIGYKTIVKTIPLKDCHQKLTIALEPDTTPLGRIEVPAKFYGSWFEQLRIRRWLG